MWNIHPFFGAMLKANFDNKFVMIKIYTTQHTYFNSLSNICQLQDYIHTQAHIKKKKKKTTTVDKPALTCYNSMGLYTHRHSLLPVRQCPSCEHPPDFGRMFTNPPPGSSIVFSKCYQPCSESPLSSKLGIESKDPTVDEHLTAKEEAEKSLTLKGELWRKSDPWCLSFTQTCAGGCTGTGRRWKHTWGLVYDPWSSYRPPQSADHSLPSLWRHRQRNMSQKGRFNAVWMMF